MSYGYSNELAHYGVKGMKWGIRKDRQKVDVDRNYVHRYKAAVAHGKNSAEFIKRYDNSYYSAIPHAGALSDERHIIPAGSSIYRTQRVGQANEKYMFVSGDKNDAKRYNYVIPTRDIPTGKKYYGEWESVELKTNHPLHGPSMREMYYAYENLLETKIPELDGKTFRQHMVDLNPNPAAKEVIGSMPVDELAMITYPQFKQFRSNDPGMETYLNQMKDWGFDYIPDLNDKGVVSDDPMIILDPGSSVTRVGSHKLNAYEINEGAINFKHPMRIP